MERISLASIKCNDLAIDCSFRTKGTDESEKHPHIWKCYPMTHNEGYPIQYRETYENRSPSWTETLMLVTGLVVSVLIIVFIIDQMMLAMII